LPNLSFILDFSYVRRDIDGEAYETLEIPGFREGHAHDDGHGHSEANSANGFNLNYGELVLSAAVDPYLDLFTAFHLSESDFEIEEAYVETRSLPYGFRLKLGKFFSGFGRLNSQHAHYWDFVDKPLVHRVFFGEEGLNEKGVQLNWLAPTSFYLDLGIESLQGTNETSFGTEEFHLIAAESEAEIQLAKVPLPNLWTLFAKTSLDIGNVVILAGTSYAFGKTRLDGFAAEEEPHGFAGDARILGLDFTAKYIFGSYTYLTLQMEYISRNLEGVRYDVSEEEEESGEEHDHEAYEVSARPLQKKQAGFYLQSVYRFHKRWRLGVRWDRLSKNRVTLDNILLELPEDLNRYSLMMDFSPTEFSRIRLQYDINRYTFREGKRNHYHRWVMQFNLAIGAHGAHPF
jgi:hypothetical protein